MEEKTYLVLSADEIILMWNFVHNDPVRFRGLFEFLVTLPAPNRTYQINAAGS